MRYNEEECDGYTKSGCCLSEIIEDTDYGHVCVECGRRCETMCDNCMDICEDFTVTKNLTHDGY